MTSGLYAVLDIVQRLQEAGRAVTGSIVVELFRKTTDELES